MELSKWDKRLWRINGLLILGVALSLALLLFSQLGQWLFRSQTRNPIQNLEQVNEKTKKKDKFRLTSPEDLEGTKSLIIRLVDDESSKNKRKGSFPSSYSMRSYESDFQNRNFLIYDKATHSSHWAFPTNGQDIRWPNKLKISKNQKSIVTALIFDYVPRIDDEISKKSDEHKEQGVSSIAIYDLQDHSLKIVLSDIEESLGVEVVSEREFLVFYFKNGKPLVAHYDLNLKKITETKSIKLPTQKAQ